MTTRDAAPYPMEDPEQLGRAFGEVFDLVDETVESVTDTEVEERLRQLLADMAEPIEPSDLNDLGRMLSRQDWAVSRRLDPAMLGADPTVPAAWDEARCALQVVWEQLSVARAAADAARREAAEQTAAAAAARQQAAEVAIGVNKYVDAALDRAEHVLADARAEAARLVAAAEQQAEEIVGAAQARAVPAGATLLAQTWPKATFTDPCILLFGVGAAGSGQTALFRAPNRILTVPDVDHCESLAAALWQPTAVGAPGFSGAAVLDDLAQQVRGLLNDPARTLPEWTGAADAYRDSLAAWTFSAEDLREALQTIVAVAVPRWPTGSYRRSVQVRYPTCAGQLELDLGAVFDEPDVLRAAHHAGPDPLARWERLPTMLSPLDTCAVPTNLGVDGDDEERPYTLAGIPVFDSAGRYVMVEIKRYDREAGSTLRVPASAPVRSLVMLYTLNTAAPDRQPLYVLNPDELRDSEPDRPASAGPLALECTCQAPPG